MTVRRRLTLQLTPLLDLLLIVIFAQFMEVREREATTVGAARRAVDDLRRAKVELAHLQATHEQAVHALERAMRTMESLTEQHKLLTQQAARAREDVDRAVAQQRLLGELVAMLFDVPDEILAQALTPEEAEGPAASADQRAFLERRFRELSLASAGRMIRHLLSYEEMRKRCDLWELHIDETGWLTLRVGDAVRGFRATTPEEFSDRLYAEYKSLPQPKSLVVIMLSYGDARGEVRDAAERGLPIVTERMRRNSAGFIRFEYAILGYQPEPLE